MPTDQEREDLLDEEYARRDRAEARAKVRATIFVGLFMLPLALGYAYLRRDEQISETEQWVLIIAGAVFVLVSVLQLAVVRGRSIRAKGSASGVSVEVDSGKRKR